MGFNGNFWRWNNFSWCTRNAFRRETLKQANEALSRGSRVLALAFSKSKIDNKNIEMPTKNFETRTD